MTMKIIYTHTDEAPALATQSLLPILEAFAAVAGVEVELRDISLAGRILAQFPDRLDGAHRVADDLAELGELAKTPEANIIKLPNISASVPQLRAAIAELREQGYAIPDYPSEPAGDEQREVRERYDRVKGSAVNPVLREGNSDRRAPASVKAYARNHPHAMGAWSPESRSHVTTMTDGDFRSTEASVTMDADGQVRIEHVGAGGQVTVLKPDFPVLAGEVLDAAVMRRAALRGVPRRPGRRCQGPGRAVLRPPQGDDDEGLRPHHLRPRGAGRTSRPCSASTPRRWRLPTSRPTTAWRRCSRRSTGCRRTSVRRSRPRSSRSYETAPALAMVDSDRGITNLHVPCDVIVDASMPAAIRSSGQMWNRDGEPQDAKFVIPDHSYADLYAETVEDCRRHGAFDPATMGTTPNVGLMAQKAEEYGSHDKTFEISEAGIVRVVDRCRHHAARA